LKKILIMKKKSSTFFSIKVRPDEKRGEDIDRRGKGGGQGRGE
jgi:hypothetical protein